MKLKKIHFSGFKSFSDPTNLLLPGRIIGVVGPNGCGKSNVIDAIRWVMGESSAKTLRGDNMSDVIFNGSSARKPVGKAVVELLFDNADGGAPGAFSQYNEISVKRSLSRDGQSDYYLNNVRCRRKDITDLFLGTGLGPRSYSIIEQGMVSRIVESKPEELRTFVEEAAGISKYKEKRRETENRIRGTRENLERVNDIRKELGTQLQRLERQSEKARKYNELNEQKQTRHLEVTALKWQQLTGILATDEIELIKHQKELERQVSFIRETEAGIERSRSQQQQAQDELNTLQGQYYAIGADINANEQRIQHARESSQKLDQQYDRVKVDLSQAQHQIELDQQQFQQLQQELELVDPQIEELEEHKLVLEQRLFESEGQLQEWQLQWDDFVQQSQNPQTQINIQDANIKQLNARLAQLKESNQRIDGELENVKKALSEIDITSMEEELLVQNESILNQQQSRDDLKLAIEQSRLQIDANQKQLTEKRHELHQTMGVLTSLKELQRAALGENDDKLNQWLDQHSMKDNPRLASVLVVDEGWERAVDSVLAAQLTAICVGHIDQVIGLDHAQFESDLTLIESGKKESSSIMLGAYHSLLNKIDSQVDLSNLLSHVFVCESQDQAMKDRNLLSANQCFVCADGMLIGRNWLKSYRSDDKAGLVSRQKAITQLQQSHSQLNIEIDVIENQVQELKQTVTQTDAQLSDVQSRLQQDMSGAQVLKEKVQYQQQRHQEMTSRHENLITQSEQNMASQRSINDEVLQSQELLQNADQQKDSYESKRNLLEQQRAQLKQSVTDVRQESEQSRSKIHEKKLSKQAAASRVESLSNNIERSKEQVMNFEARLEVLQEERIQIHSPETDLREKIVELLDAKKSKDVELRSSRESMTVLESEIISQNQQRQKMEIDSNKVREVISDRQLKRQEFVINQRQQLEIIEQANRQPKDILDGLEDGAQLEAWANGLAQIISKIEKLGTVNLLAIEEYDEQSERKTYLDKQNDDLVEALDTLEAAMRKIDKETKERFKTTFEGLNANFKKIFPKLFGGGSASLELTDDDLLSTGVTVIAQPPGKRNSTIHLLSGGEKALAAVSLLFALFQLSPAPFCILDEVDAPLDDANVERYSNILKEMAKTTQLLFISHNKITMEIADLLVGVTMQEPGVSKIVAVDVAQAVDLAS